MNPSLEGRISTISFFNSIVLKFGWPNISHIGKLTVLLSVSKALPPTINLATDLE